MSVSLPNTPRPPRASRHHHSRGMTLVEVLIAMAIASLMTLTGWRAIDALQTARDKVTTDAFTWQRIDDFFATLESDLRRASLIEFSGEPDHLTLVQPPIDGDALAAVVRYTSTATPAGSSANSLQATQRIERDAGSTRTAMADVRAVSFSYSVDGVVFTPTAATYPRALRVRIIPAGGGSSNDSVERTLALR